MNGTPEETTRVIFLDIDGPMIPDTMLLAEYWASWQRKMPPTTVAVVNCLCKESGARIVTNTTHNHQPPAPRVPDEDLTPIKEALIREGVKPDYFHKDSKTQYPDVSRMAAVNHWLSAHPEVSEWLIIDDDAQFAHSVDPNVLWVDPGTGLAISHLERALRHFGITKMPFTW